MTAFTPNRPIIEAPQWLLSTFRTPAAVDVADAPSLAAPFPPASASVLSAAASALEAFGPAISGDAGDNHTFVAAAILRHDFALSEAEAWPLFQQWNATCEPPWDEINLRSKLRGGLKYGSGEFGSKRHGDSLERVRFAIAKYRVAPNEPAMLALIEQCRTLTWPEPLRREIAENELRAETGLRPKALALQPARNLDAERAQHERRNRPGVIDADAPHDLAKAFLKDTADDSGLAEFVRWQGEFWQAQGTHYASAKEEYINKLIYKWLEAKTDENGSRVKSNKTLVENIKHAMAAEALTTADQSPVWLDGRDTASDAQVSFKNGTLNTRTNEFSPPARALFNTNVCDYSYSKDESAPKGWLNFLDQLWSDDSESIATLQEIFGLMLTGDTSHQKLFMLLGPKRSGKGTIARILAKLVGSANTCAPTLNGLGTHFGLESMIGRRLAIVSDARVGAKVDTAAVVENLLRISGEDTISVPRKNKTDFSAKLSTRFLIISNDVPELIDQAGALSSRFIALKLKKSFYGQEDRTLTEKLETELPGICLWALEGLDRLQKRGKFVQPDSGLQTLSDLSELAVHVEPWEKIVLDYAERAAAANEAVNTPDIATSALLIEVGRQSPRDTARIAGVLKRNGWEQVRDRKFGDQMRHWVKAIQV